MGEKGDVILPTTSSAEHLANRFSDFLHQKLKKSGVTSVLVPVIRQRWMQIESLKVLHSMISNQQHMKR